MSISFFNLQIKLADRLRQLRDLYNHNRQFVDDSTDKILNRATKRLLDLITEAKRLVNDGTTNPNELNEYSALLLDAIHDGLPLTEGSPELQEAIKSNFCIKTFLMTVIPDAEHQKSILDDLWKKWQLMSAQFEQIAQKQHELRIKLLEQTEGYKGERSMDDANKDLDDLKVRTYWQIN